MKINNSYLLYLKNRKLGKTQIPVVIYLIIPSLLSILVFKSLSVFIGSVAGWILALIYLFYEYKDFRHDKTLIKEAEPLEKNLFPGRILPTLLLMAVLFLQINAEEINHTTLLFLTLFFTLLYMYARFDNFKKITRKLAKTRSASIANFFVHVLPIAIISLTFFTSSLYEDPNGSLFWFLLLLIPVGVYISYALNFQKKYALTFSTTLIPFLASLFLALKNTVIPILIFFCVDCLYFVYAKNKIKNK